MNVTTPDEIDQLVAYFFVSTRRQLQMRQWRKSVTHLFPSNTSAFFQHLWESGELRHWAVTTISIPEPVGPDEDEPATFPKEPTVFYLRGTDPLMDGRVSFEEDGRPSVSLDAYCLSFDLRDLYYDFDGSTLRDEVSREPWCTPQHLNLIDALMRLFPFPEQATVVKL